MRSALRSVCWLLACIPLGALAQPRPALPPPAPHDIRGAHYPALSPDGKRICFEYAGDLWTAPTAGGTATRLTVNRAYDAYPEWSPDGRWIAFSSNRQGNFDVYIIPARGGDARQITFHSADDIVSDWSPDGTQILFTSAREGRFADLYTISLKDGRLQRLTSDRTSSRYGVFAPDGKSVLYVRGGQSWWRPRYRGSANTDIWSLPLARGAARRLTSFDGWDCWPMEMPGGRVTYYVSEQGGTSNLWRMDAGGGTPVEVTHHKDGPVRFPTMARDGSCVAYEQGFRIWVLPLRPDGTSAADPTPISLMAPTDQLQNADRYLTLTSGASSIALSPDGRTLAFALRGELWTCPSDGGDATRPTTNGSSEYAPVWSPDGKLLAYTTDRAGSLDVYVMDVKTKAERRVTSDPADDTRPTFSPNGRFVAWLRTGGSEPGLYVAPISDTGEVAQAGVTRVGPGPGVSSYNWSPDSRWVVYSKRDATSTSDLWVAPTVGGTPVNITRYPGMNGDPHWTRDGSRIVFVSSRGGTPGSPSYGIYSVEVLPRPQRDEAGPDAPPPGTPEPPSPDEPEAQRRRRQPPPGAGEAGPSPGMPMPPVRIPPRAELVRIEFDGIQDRARPAISTREPAGNMMVSPDARTVVFTMNAPGGPPDWWAVDLVSGSLARLTTGGEGGSDVEFAPDAGRFYFRSGDGTIRQLPRGAGSSAPVGFSATMDVDRRVEVAEAFNEAWRNLRTRFYDPKMHGADWKALRARYEPLLVETYAKEDFAWLLSSMVGELNASHLGVTPPPEPGPWPATAYLGLLFDQRYAGPGLKVARVLPKGPADQLGRHVEPGEYVMAIDGVDVSFAEDLYKTLRDKAGKPVELTVNSRPVNEGARSAKVRPITKSASDDLDYEAWVAERRRKVDALSGGQLAYIHIRAMDQASLQRFQRELFGDAQSKKGLVLDVRFNGGGRIHDDLLSILARKPHVYEVPRDGERATQPFQLWARPTVLLINEYSASDAEIFPNGFRQYGLGKLVGVPTNGAVIGTFNITLVDGTGFRIPTSGWYTLDGKNMEGTGGVAPDVRVEQTPEDNAADNDRQLEAAVKVLMDQMRGSPTGPTR